MEDKKFDGTEGQGEEKMYKKTYVDQQRARIRNLEEALEKAEKKTAEGTSPSTPSPEMEKAIKALQAQIDSLEAKRGDKSLSTEALSESIAAALSKHQNLRNGKPVLFTTKDINPKDFNKEGVSFICHAAMHLVHTDMRDGQPVVVPYGKPVMFGNTENSRVKNGNREDIYYRCYAKVHSNEVIEFMRNHTEYGFKFFELGKKINQPEDRLKMDCLLAASKQVDGCDHVRLVGLAEAYKVDMGQHPDDIRMAVKQKIADAEYEKQVKRSKTLLIETDDARRFK